MADQTPNSESVLGPREQAIMKGFRTQYPDYSDMSDDDVLVKMYQKHYSDMTPEDYMGKMQAKFAPDYKEAEAPTGVVPFLKGVGGTLAGMPAAFATGMAKSLASPLETVGHATAGNQLEQTALDMPEPHIGALRRRGYSEQQIRNIVTGYAKTQQSILGDVEEQAQQGVRSSAEAAAMYATLPLGGGAAAGLKATGRLIPMAAEQAAKHTLTQSVGVGAMFGAGYGAIDEGIVKGSEAAANGAGASQILSEATKGAMHGGMEGAAYGALGGAAFHGLGSAVTAARLKFDPAFAARKAALDASAVSARAAGLKDFASKFDPRMVLSRFKPDLDYWVSLRAKQPDVPVEHLAANIASKLYGPEVMAKDPASVQLIAQKLTQFFETQDKLTGVVNLPSVAPTEAALIAQPPGEALNATGGIAPDRFPPEVQGPVVQPTATPFAPPAEPVPAMAGLEANRPAGAAPMPVTPEALTPEMQPHPPGVAPMAGSTAETMRQPLDIERMPAAEPTEVAPRLGGLETPAPEPGVEPIKLTLPPERPTAREGTSAMQDLSLPTGPVERVTRAVAESGPVVEGLTTTARKLGGATVDVTPSADGTHVLIKNIQGSEHGTGASAKALDAILKSADEAQAPVMVTASDVVAKRGGKVSAEKIAQWYEKRGFRRTGDETTGTINLVRAPRDPNALTEENMKRLFEQRGGSKVEQAREDWANFTRRVDGLSPEKVEMALGNTRDGEPMIRPVQAEKKIGIPERAPQTDLFAEMLPKVDAAEQAARTRLNRKLGKMNVGFDPTMIGDAAIIGAAKMYRLGLTRFKPWAEEMVKEFGENIAEHLKPIFTKAQDFLKGRMEKASVTFETANKILAMSRSGRQGYDWYNKYLDWAQRTFGDDAGMFTRFLSATSAGMSTDSNVTLALKAYAQWKLGLPFDGFMGTHRTMLEQAARGETFGDRKIQNITRALMGDENAVVIDTRVMRTLGFKVAGKGTKVGDSVMNAQSALTGPQYQLFEAVIRDLARQEGLTPREFQSTLWVGNKIAEAQEANAIGSKKAMSSVANFHPYEKIAERTLGGLTPLEWIQKNRVRYEQMAAASEGVTATRAGGGFTYDPYTFKKLDADKGIVVTLASKKLKTGELTGTEVIDFAKRFKRLTDAYYGMNVGTFNLDKYEPGKSSIDFNIVLPEEMRDVAVELGRSRGQHALWDLAKGEEIPTGFKGKSSELPKGNLNKLLDELDALLQRLDVPGRAMKDSPFERTPDLFTTHHKLSSSTLEAMTRTPHRWAEYAAQALGVDEEKGVRDLVDQGKLKPMTDYDMINKVEVHKDGTVWEFVDPEGPSYNIMKLVGYLKAKDVPGRELLGGRRLLDYLEGKDVVSGHEVIADYKSQAGFARVGMLVPKKAAAAVTGDQSSKVISALTKSGGEVVKDLSEFQRTDPQGMSLWIAPNGKVVKVPFHLRSADAVIKATKLKNPVQYEGPEHADMQTMLNHGFVRIQMHADSYAGDATKALTDAQITSLKALQKGRGGKRDFVARTINPNGEHRAFHQGDRAIYDFIADLEKGGK
jgi:hypothetical protein